MKGPRQPATGIINFNRWSRKSYAAFNSLGRIIKIGVLCLTSSIIVMPGHTQAVHDSVAFDESAPPLELEEVVVSAQLAPVVQSELMRTIQVITRQEIERSPAPDIASLLQNIRGIDIRKRGAFGMQSDISVRGGTFDQTLILLNGINITDPQTGHHNLNLPIDLAGIERIEILSGAAARLFGPNAFNGAINIITRQPGTKEMTISAALGEHQLSELNASAGFNTAGITHFLSLSGMSSDGFTHNTDFKTGNVYYRSAIPVKKNSLDWQAGFNAKGFGANSFYSPRYPNQYEETRTTFASVSWVNTGKIKIHPTIYWRRHNDRFELFRSQPPQWYTSHNYHQTDVFGASLNWSSSGALGTTSAGIDYRLEHIYSNVLGEPLQKPVAATGYDSIYYTRSFQRNGISLMAEHTVYLGDFSASAGLLTWINNSLKSGVSFFPGLDLGWQISPGWRWFSSFNRTLRLPTFTDLFYNGPTNTGNPLLTPEQATSVETGLKNSWGRIQMETAVFYRRGVNMIDWVKKQGDEKWMSMNHTRVNVKGLEWGIQVPLSHVLPYTSRGMSLHYSYISSGKLSGDFVSNYVLDHLRHKIDAGLNYSFSPSWGLSLNVSWNERAGGFMLYEEGVFQDIRDFEPYWMADIKAFYKFRNYTLFTEVTNLFNTEQVSIANVPQPGRWARIGIKADFSY